MNKTTSTTSLRSSGIARAVRRMSLGGTAAALALTGALALPAVATAAPTVTPSSWAPMATSQVEPAVVTAQASRPGNGTVLLKRGSGRGQFTVSNTRGADDAVVTLARNGRAVLVLYVRAGAKATATKVPDGSFDVFTEQGRTWDRSATRFITQSSAGEFDRKAGFRTQRIANGIRYSVITVTLQAVPGGNARVVPAPGAAIPN